MSLPRWKHSKHYAFDVKGLRKLVPDGTGDFCPLAMKFQQKCK